jgi:cobalt/nickel transport system permease protein
VGVLLTAFMVSLSIAFSQDAFLPAARLILIIYLPLAIVESAVTGTVVAFVWRVAPELLQDRFAGASVQQHG